jgi:hypothetical protein
VTKAREILGSIAEGIDGLLAAAFCDMNGTIIATLVVDSEFGIESITGEVTTAAKLFLYLERKSHAGPVDHFLVRCERITFLAAFSGRDYCVVLCLSDKGNVGRARMQLRRYLAELVRAAAPA